MVQFLMCTYQWIISPDGLGVLHTYNILFKAWITQAMKRRDQLQEHFSYHDVACSS